MRPVAPKMITLRATIRIGSGVLPIEWRKDEIDIPDVFNLQGIHFRIYVPLHLDLYDTWTVGALTLRRSPKERAVYSGR